MSVKLITEDHLEFLTLKVCYTGSSKSTIVKIPRCWKSHVMTHTTGKLLLFYLYIVVEYYCTVSILAFYFILHQFQKVNQKWLFHINIIVLCHPKTVVIVDTGFVIRIYSRYYLCSSKTTILFFNQRKKDKKQVV